MRYKLLFTKIFYVDYDGYDGSLKENILFHLITHLLYDLFFLFPYFVFLMMRSKGMLNSFKGIGYFFRKK